MFENTIVKELFKYYSSLIKENNNKLNMLGESTYFYYFDDIQSNGIFRNVYHLDISSAYPTMTKILFGVDSEIYKTLLSYDNKFEKNKYLAITLKKMAETDKINYINIFDIFCKIIILGSVYNKYNNVEIIEFEKDGCLFIGEELKEPKINEFEILKNKNEIKIKKSFFDIYIRHEKSSIYYSKNDNSIRVKGKWKNIPQYVSEELLFEIFNNNFSNIRKYYNLEYYKFLLKLENKNLLYFYYAKYNLKEILSDFIYPIINYIRL